jgi:PAS domain S-box-containing protein
MNDATRTRSSKGLLAGLLAVAAGVAVLAGWLFDIPGLKSVLPGFVTMKVNTAVGFILAGLSLALLGCAPWSAWVRQLSRVCAGATALLGLLTLCQYLFGLDFGIDQLLFREAAGAVGALSLGRMSPATAVNFLLLGCALFLAGFRRAIPAAQRLVLVTGLMGLLPLVGYVYGATALIGIGQYTQMAIYTAVLFILVSLGVLLLHPADGLMRTVTGDTVGGWLLRRLMPFVIGVPLALGWLRVQGEQRGYFNGPLGVALMMVVMMLILTGLIAWTARALNRSDAERKKAAEALRESEERLRRVVNATKDGIWEWDIQTSREYFAPRWCEILGYSSEDPELPHTFDSWASRIHPDDRDRVMAAMKSHLDRGTEYNVDYRHRHKSGEYRWQNSRGERLLGESGKPIKMVGIIADITERKRVEAQALAAAVETRRLLDVAEKSRHALLSTLEDQKLAEAELRESEVRYRALFEHSADGILIADLDTKVFMYANPAVCRMLGYTEDEMRTMGMLDIHPKDAVQSAVAEFEAQARGEKPLASDLPCLRKDGTILYADVNATAVAIDNRPCLVGFFRDVTERKRAEGQRAALEDQLRQVQKMESIGRLAGGVAHDFNNILTGIGGYTELALGQLDAASPLREDLAEVMRLAKRAAELTRQLLAFSRRQPLAMQVLYLNDMVADTTKMLKRVLGEAIDLHFTPAPDLGNVRADSGQMEQILINLAINSRDAMPTGGKLTIETANIELDADYAGRHVAVTPGPHVMLAVSDTGRGMDAATKERLFEPFFTTKEKGKGTGLGLATVYGIVKQHGGHIWVYSEPGQGATFKIYLPRVAEAVADAKPPAEPETVGGGETILIVEDEGSVCSIAERALKAQGYAVLTASSAEEAEQLFLKQPKQIALLLTDVVLPGMNGRNLYDRLKGREPDLKVIYMSGYTDNAIVHQGVLDVGTAFMQKPFMIETVARKVRQVLDS